MAVISKSRLEISRGEMKFRSPKTIFLAYLIAISLILVSGAGWNPIGVDWNFSNVGQFGDAFGPINSVMTAIAATAAYLAYKSQAEELERIKSEAQAEKLARDSRDFDHNFFNLLNVFREIVKEIEIEDRYNANPQKGRDAIRLFIDEHVSPSRDLYSGDGQAYAIAFERFRDDLAHYFRIFYNLLRFINESPIENKKRYTRLLRSTLSEAEITVIALNCLYGGGNPKLKRLVEKYEILHNISNSSARNWHLIRQFRKTAFGSRKITSAGNLES
jgi:Putative phage abortive infection protein